MDIETLFMLNNLPKLNDNDTYVKCITKANDGIPLGMPAIVNASALESLPEKKVIPNKYTGYDLLARKSDQDILVMFPFAVRGIDIHAYRTWQINKKRVNVVSQPSFIEEHVVKEVDHFAWKEMKDEIMELTQGPGLSLIIKGEEGIKHSINEVRKIKYWLDYYTMVDYLCFDQGKMSDPDEEIICIMNFFNLSDCLPVFNPKKAYGFGLSFNLAFEEKVEGGTRRHNIQTVESLCNTYPDNLFIIDGQNLPGSRTMDTKGFSSDFLNALATYKEKSLELCKELEKSNGKKNLGLRDYRKYVNTTGTYSGATSNTGHYEMKWTR